MSPEEAMALKTADIRLDRVYIGGRSGNASDDPLPHLVGVSNQGGFRYIGNNSSPKLVVLTSTLSDPDWPDDLDRETGVFTYFGDNKKAGPELHETPRFGNNFNQLRAAVCAVKHAVLGRRRPALIEV